MNVGVTLGMNTMIDLIVMEHAKELYPENKVPLPATPGSAAIDLIAAIPEDIIINPGSTMMVKTGLRMHMRDPGVCAMVLPRSGLGSKYGLVLGNLVGLIDNDYQGELMCAMWNRNEQETQKHCVVHRGERIAQMIFVPFLKPQFTRLDADEFPELTTRGSGGFGSTGAN